MNLKGVIIFANVLGLLMSQGGFAHEIQETQEFHQELKRLKDQQGLMQRELQEMKTLLAERGIGLTPQPQDLLLGVTQEHFKGDPDAVFTLVEFTDYQCPFCRRHVQQTFPDLQKEYIDTGKIKYVVRDFPLQSLHREAFQAAVAADCAGEQGHYWEMHDRLLTMEAPFDSNWGEHAHVIGLDVSQFQECFKSEQAGEGVRRDLEEGRKVGVRGTPTFFLGIKDKNNQGIKVLKVMRGAQSYAKMKHSIDEFLVKHE